MDNQEKMKKKLQTLGKNMRTDVVTVICKSCGGSNEINTNNPQHYSEEVRNKFQCWRCKTPTNKRQVVKDKPSFSAEVTKPIVEIPAIENPIPIVKEAGSKSIKLTIRKDGVLRVAQKYIDGYGYKGGDTITLTITKDGIVIIKVTK